MAEQFCDLGEIRLCYETFGDPGDPPLLLVMGLGTQMLGWHEDFCEQLAGEGFHVIRFDNRDIGLSTHLDDLRAPSLGQIVRRTWRGYDLADMAADAVGLLDHLEIDRAHIVGASMGGMIAQTIAARHPDRVLSLTSIMSTTGGRFVGQPALKAYRFLMTRPRGREEAIERAVALFGVVGSTAFDRDEAELRERAGNSYDRANNPWGVVRQLGAVGASGDRTEELRRIKAPTLVLHGTVDKLVSPSGGRATARAIRGAQLEWIEGMGHDLPRGAWPQLIEATVAHARAADRAAAPA
jgi:pimeloyl-ACP methyl ester carboxylesterase